MHDLSYDRSKLDALCKAYRVKKLSIFGSVAYGNASDHSDLDILVDLGPEHSVGLFQFFRLQHELTEIFGRPVDLNTAGFLDRAFREDVIQHAQAIYAG